MFEKHRKMRELTAEEFIELLRAIMGYVAC